MANSSNDTLFLLHRDATQQYAYFLLAAAGAAIGLAVNQTQSKGLSISLFPLGLAVLSWGGSFVFGCLQIERQHEFLRLNALLLEVSSGRNALANSDTRMMAVALGDTTTLMQRAIYLMRRFAVWQFRFLVIGGGLYIIWHIWQMYLRT
ncbi:MAG TPA: hypothetical protein VIJ62_11860 [Rhizomicrobium sp.]